MKPLSVGFTGTREHLTRRQFFRLLKVIGALEPTEVHHGDCVGADSDMHRLIRTIGGIHVVVHPPDDETLRAGCLGDLVYLPQPYLERNRAIVDETTVLVACPAGPEASQPRSGTWATIRYARKRKRRIILVMP